MLNIVSFCTEIIACHDDNLLSGVCFALDSLSANQTSPGNVCDTYLSHNYKHCFQVCFLKYFEGAYARRGLSTEENLRFKIDWASLIVGSKFAVFALFYFVFEVIGSCYLRAIFQVQAPEGLMFEGQSNGGVFALPVWGAYIWRGLFMERLIFGILRYVMT